MRPDDVGFVGTNLVLGKHSGRHAFRDRIQSLGHTLDDETFQKVFDDFITLADKKKEVYDSDIVALIENRIGTHAASVENYFGPQHVRHEHHPHRHGEAAG